MDIIEKRSTVIEIALELYVAKNTVYDWIRENDKIIDQIKASGQHGPVYITE